MKSCPESRPEAPLSGRKRADVSCGQANRGETQQALARASQGAADTPGSRWDNLPRWREQCRTYRIQVNTREIGFVNAVLESYDDIARVQTEDTGRGIVSVLVPVEWDDTFRLIVASLARKRDVRFLD